MMGVLVGVYWRLGLGGSVGEFEVFLFGLAVGEVGESEGEGFREFLDYGNHLIMIIILIQ
jgi:hypothetical protein